MQGQTLGERAAAAGRINNFNAIRLILASLVIVSHSAELIDGNRSREALTMVFGTLSFGELAVDGFFLLSGYLLTQSWSGCPSARVYLRNRVLRIYPGFIVASLASIFVVGAIATVNTGYFARVSGWAVLGDLAVLRPPAAPGAFAGTPYPAVNGSLWTIPLEFSCYLGVLVLGMAGVLRKRGAMLGVALACGALYMLERMFDLGPLENWKVQGAIRLGFCFSVGALFYTWRSSVPFQRRIAWAAALGLLAGMFSTRFVELAVAACGGYLLFYLGYSRLPVLHRLKRETDISYGVYLYGWPVQKLLIFWYPAITPAALTGASLGAAVLLALISWHLVERPFMNLKKRRSVRPTEVTKAYADSVDAK